MTDRIARVRIPATFADLRVEATREGARLIIGTVHVHLKRDIAVALANQLVDATETKETA